MIKLKQLLSEKYLGFGNQQKLNEQEATAAIANQFQQIVNDKTNTDNDPAVMQCVLDCIKQEIKKDLPTVEEREVDQLIDGLKNGQIVRITNAISNFTVNLGNLATFVEAMLSPDMCKQCEGIQTTPTGNVGKPI